MFNCQICPRSAIFFQVGPRFRELLRVGLDLQEGRSSLSHHGAPRQIFEPASTADAVTF